jgi:hypothetical protein
MMQAKKSIEIRVVVFSDHMASDSSHRMYAHIHHEGEVNGK